MKTRLLGLSGIEVSELCLGSMNFGNPRIGVDEATSRQVIDAYLDAGGNFIDTADAYANGESEEILGRALEGRRDGVVLATKGYFPHVEKLGDPPLHANALGCSRRHLTLALEASLRRLRSDWVDLYQVHCWDPRTPVEETLSTLDDFVRSGKVRYVGLSNYSAWQIAETRMLCRQHGWEPFVSAQMQYSLICRELEQDVVPVCQRYGIGLLPWSPLGQGMLTGKYQRDQRPESGTRFGVEPANDNARRWRQRFMNERTFGIADAVTEQADALGSTPVAVSLAWLLTRPAVSSVIIGPKDTPQLEQNLAAAELELPAETLERLGTVSEPEPRYPEWFIAMSPRA